MAARLRMAMVGGGKVAAAHYVGAVRGAGIALVAGSFSANVDRSRAVGARFGVDSSRCYDDFEEMFARDAAIDLVAILTPNHLHLPVAVAALAAGVHVMSDKPATATLAEALALEGAVAASDGHYALSYTYSGYPMVRKARALVADGAIGAVRKIVVTYQQAWRADAERADAAAAWRIDPAQSGVGGASADIGVHAFHLAEFVSGQRVSAMFADTQALRAGAALDDDCTVLLRFGGGQTGVLVISQIAFGEGNGLSFQIFGDGGALHWSFATGDELQVVSAAGERRLVQCDAADGIDARDPATGFATLYRDFAAVIAAASADCAPLLPGIEAGVRGMRFVEHAVAGRAIGSGWRSFDPTDDLPRGDAR